MKRIEDMDWNELEDHLTQLIHAGLLEGGGKGLKSAVSFAMSLTLRWEEAQKEKSKEHRA